MSCFKLCESCRLCLEAAVALLCSEHSLRLPLPR